MAAMVSGRALRLLLVAVCVGVVGIVSSIPSVEAALAQAPTTTTAPAGSAPLPSVATEGTTATSGESADDPAQDRLRYIIIGLVVLAVIIVVLTVLFWRATDPNKVITVEELAPLELGDRPAIPTGTAVSAQRGKSDPMMAPNAPLPVGGTQVASLESE